MYVDTKRIGGAWVFANCAGTQAPGGAEQRETNNGHQYKGQVRDQALIEQHQANIVQDSLGRLEWVGEHGGELTECIHAADVQITCQTQRQDIDNSAADDLVNIEADG